MQKRITTLLIMLMLVIMSAVPTMAEEDVVASSGDNECDHQWTEWTMNYGPTCSNPGEEARHCLLCSTFETRQIAPTGNHIVNNWQVKVPSSIASNGIDFGYCSVCGYLVERETDRLTPFAYFKAGKYKVTKGKSLKPAVVFANGDSIKNWKSSKKSVATVNKKGKVVGKKTGTVIITVVMKSGAKATCKVKVVKAKKKSKKARTAAHAGGGTVYWTPSGGVYHYSRNCPTLSRSRTINSGSINASGKSRACKVCS